MENPYNIVYFIMYTQRIVSRVIYYRFVGGGVLLILSRDVSKTYQGLLLEYN